MNATKNWWNNLTFFQKSWIFGFTGLMLILGILSHDSTINILIGCSGALYTAVYTTGTRYNFLLGCLYVGLYTIICLQNRIMLDAIQNIVLIPLYLFSFFYWGKKNIKPRNLSTKQAVIIIVSAIVVLAALFGLSKLLHGNYSMLDAINTTCTLYAMVLGIFGASCVWWFWSVNNIISAIIFGMALFTPTGSLTVFVMKCVFMLNGFIGWYNFHKIGKQQN